MTKPDFTAHLNRARVCQSAFPFQDTAVRALYYDTLYDKFKNERDEDVIKALDRIGDTNTTINYANVKALIDEGSFTHYAKPARPLPPESAEDKKAIKAMIAKLKKKMER